MSIFHFWMAQFDLWRFVLLCSKPIMALPRCQNLVSLWKAPKSLPLKDKTFCGVCLSVASVSASGAAKDLSPVRNSQPICICPCSRLAWAHYDKNGSVRLIRVLRNSHDRSVSLHLIWSDFLVLLMLFDFDMCQVALRLSMYSCYYCVQESLLSSILNFSCLWCFN